jgi:hypothetical protein
MKIFSVIFAVLLALVGGESLAFGQAATTPVFASTGCVLQNGKSFLFVNEAGRRFLLEGMDLRAVTGSQMYIWGVLEKDTVRVKQAKISRMGGCESATGAAGMRGGAAAGAAAAGAAGAAAASGVSTRCLVTLFVGCLAYDGLKGVVHAMHDPEKPKAEKPAKPQPGPTREALLKAANQQLNAVKPAKVRFSQQDVYRMAYTNGPYGEDIMLRLNSALKPYSLIVGKGNLFWVLMTQGQVEVVEVGPGMKFLISSGAIVTTSAPWSGSVLVFKYQDPKAGLIEIPLVRLDTADIVTEVPLNPAEKGSPIQAIPVP